MTKEDWIAWDLKRVEMGLAPIFPANGGKTSSTFERHIAFHIDPPTEEPGWSVTYSHGQLIAVHPNHPPQFIPLNWRPFHA